MRIISSLLITIIVIVAAYYLNPFGLKQKAADSISELGFIPDDIKTKIEGVLLSPKERRERLITKLENNLANLKTSLASSQSSTNGIEAQISSNAITIIEESEKLLQEIKESNEDPGLVNTAATKIIEEIKEEVKQGVTEQLKKQKEESSDTECKCSN